MSGGTPEMANPAPLMRNASTSIRFTHTHHSHDYSDVPATFLGSAQLQPGEDEGAFVSNFLLDKKQRKGTRGSIKKDLYLSLKSAEGLFTCRTKPKASAVAIVTVPLDAIRGMAILGEKFALVRERVDPMGVPTGVTVLAFKFKKKTDAVDMLQALQQSTLAVPVTHQVRTRQGHRLSYSVDGGDSNQSGSAGPRTVFDQPVSDVVVHKTTNMFTSDGAVADNRVLLRRLTEVTEQRDASEKGRIEAITRALMAEKEAASARREMADMRLEVSRVAADMATDMAQMKLDAVAETEQQVLSEVQKIKRGLELIDSRMMRRTQQPYTHPEKCTPAQFWADAEALHAEDPDQPPPEPRRASHAGSQNSSYLRLRRGDSESKLRASIAKNMEDDAKLEALPKEQLIAVVKVQRSRQQELSELPATVRMLEEDLAKAQASNDRLAKELVDMQSEFASKLAFLEAEKNLLADTIAGQEKATLNGSGGPSPLAALPESPQNGGKDGADSQAAAAGSPRRNGRASLGNDPLAEDTTEFELLEGVLSMVPEAEADNGYLVVAPEVRAEPAEAAPAPSAAPAVEVAVPTVVVHPASDADVSGPPAASPGQPAASFSANGPQPPMVEWVKVRADHPSGRGKELRVPAEAVAARPLDAFVELHKQDGAGLGFSIAGGVDDPVKPGMTGVFITSITPGGTADRSGCLSMGDCLLAVDGTSLENVLHDTAAKALQSTGVDVALTVRRFPEKEIFVEVEFVKGSQGLGFSISGGTDDPVREDDNCVYVTSIVPNGAADVDDRLRIGDKLLTVNGASMMSITHPAAVSLLQKVTHTITLVVARVPIMEDHTLASSTNITGQTAQNTTLGMSLSQPNATVPVVEDIIEVAFPRDPQTGAGIIVTGGKDHPVDQGDTAIYITRIVPGGAAERDGRLLPGDRIVEMDDIHLLSATTEGVAAAMVKPGDGIIKLTVTRLPHEQVEETLHIAFQKGPEGLGFTIAGGTGDVGDNGDAAIYVVKIIPGGVAEADGRLCKYDKIVQVNGQPMQNASHDQAVQALLSNPTGVDLVVSRLVDPSDTLNETGELVMSVILEKDTQAGLGFSIAGGRDDEIEPGDAGIYITAIGERGAAVKDGRLRFGDRLCEVNGISVENVDHDTAVNLLQKSETEVHLKIARLPTAEAVDGEVILHIEFPRGAGGLGLSVAGGIDAPIEEGDDSIYVTNVNEGGPAAMDGRLAMGDKLLVVNGISMVGQTHSKAVEALQCKNGCPRLRWARNASLTDAAWLR